MIRVAYEVSFTVPPPGMPPAVTGVGRVIQEQLRCLRKNANLDVKIVGGFGGDWNPIITSLASQKWASSILKPPAPSLKGYRVRSRLGEVAINALYKGQVLSNQAGEKGQLGSVGRIRMFSLAALRKFAHSQVEWGMGRDEVDVFHSTFRAPPDWLSPAVPRVVTIHDVIPLRFRDEYDLSTVGSLESVLASLKPDRDVVAAVSEFTKQDFCDISGFPRERVVVAPLSAGNRFRPITDSALLSVVRGRYGIGERPFLLSVSNPQPRKNIPLLVRSFYSFLRRLPSWEGCLVLVGNVKVGFGAEVIQQEIDKQPDLANRVVQAGGVSDEDLQCLYSACEAFLFPSTLEGFGLPVLEAMQCGAPVICSNSSSLPGVVGDDAILVDPKDEARLSEAIFDLVSDSALRRDLATRSLRRAAQFSWEASAERVAEAYEMALKPSSQPAKR